LSSKILSHPRIAAFFRHGLPPVNLLTLIVVVVVGECSVLRVSGVQKVSRISGVR
jgi:hypothetical protein